MIDHNFIHWVTTKKLLPKNGQKVLACHECGCDQAIYNSKQKTFDVPYYGQEIVESFINVTEWVAIPKRKNA